MEKPSRQSEEPRGSSWRHNFKNPEVEGFVSVGFDMPVQQIAVIFRPPSAGATNYDTRHTPKPKSLLCIQMFDASNGKDPCSDKAAELTHFGMPSSPKGVGRLILTIKFTRTSTPVSYIVLSGKDDTGTYVEESVHFGASGSITRPGFAYTVIAADSKEQIFILEFSAWPEGDPLVSYG